jgi:hypothetical protein
MSHLRPECKDAKDSHAPGYADSLYMIRESVRRRDTLIYGRLHDNGNDCAIGAFFRDNPKLALKSAVIDEVASVNDSLGPKASPRARRAAVLRFLNFKIKRLCRSEIVQLFRSRPRRFSARYEYVHALETSEAVIVQPVNGDGKLNGAPRSMTKGDFDARYEPVRRPRKAKGASNGKAARRAHRRTRSTAETTPPPTNDSTLVV